VRKNFADSAFWIANIETNENGEAEVSFNMPENLSEWSINTWAVGHGTSVGQSKESVVTRKNLILRMQAPRFFIEKDEVVLSANIHNYLKSSQKIKAMLELDGKQLEVMEGKIKNIEINSGGEARIDWRVKVVKEGEAVIRMKAIGEDESDAMEMKFPVYVHGMDKMDSACGVIRPDQNIGNTIINVPQQRRIDSARLEIRYSPSLATAIVDALPYMAEYPYGCTEQTLNRFVPTVIAQNIINKMGISLEDIRDKKINFNSQEIGDTAERAKRWKMWERNPVFDSKTVTNMVEKGVKDLTNMQLSDGGWGWFGGWGEHSYYHTTAVVVHGLQVAKKNGAAIVPGTLKRGIEWLKRYQNKQVQELINHEKDIKMSNRKSRATDGDALVYMVLSDENIFNSEMKRFLYRDKDKLSVYGKAIFGIGLDNGKDVEKRDMILKNIEQYLVRDDENQTEYLNLGNQNYWWYWYGSEIEAHAFYLKLLCRVSPKSERASRIVKYLINNRSNGTYWNSTRDTAYSIEALSEYVLASGENEPDMTVEVWIDNKKRKEIKITKESIFDFDNTFVQTGKSVTGGKHKVELRKKGKGRLYWNVYTSYFTLEDYIKKSGLEVKVNRKIYKLEEVDKKIKVSGSLGQAIDQKVQKYKRVPVENMSELKSGDLVEVELVIDSKNDYEYILIEDMKAAGFEAVEVRSGYNGNSMGAYAEFRDNRVCFFVRSLMRGKHSVSYRLRAEIPGKFSALPAKISAMYAPELRGNSDEIKLLIKD
jgi:hypothetical protein